jgi:hypothetical protein
LLVLACVAFLCGSCQTKNTTGHWQPRRLQLNKVEDARIDHAIQEFRPDSGFWDGPFTVDEAKPEPLPFPASEWQEFRRLVGDQSVFAYYYREEPFGTQNASTGISACGQAFELWGYCTVKGDRVSRFIEKPQKTPDQPSLQMAGIRPPAGEAPAAPPTLASGL